MRLLIVGDLHGNDRYFKHVVQAATDKRCDVIVQCGDLGFWPHTNPEYLVRLAQDLYGSDDARAKEGLPPLKLYWIDGNHENFDALWENICIAPQDCNYPNGRCVEPSRCSFPKTHYLSAEGFWRISDRIFYAPRGHRWEWSEVSFLALGGANSIDKKFRVEHRSWWKQELITPADVDKAIKGGHADIMICHDMPQGVDAEEGPRLDIKDQPEDERNRNYVRVVVDTVKPKLLYHGHYHYRYNSDLEGTKIIGLDCDGSFEKNWVVLDLDEFKEG